MNNVFGSCNRPGCTMKGYFHMILYFIVLNVVLIFHLFVFLNKNRTFNPNLPAMLKNG